MEVRFAIFVTVRPVSNFFNAAGYAFNNPVNSAFIIKEKIRFPEQSLRIVKGV